MWDWAGVSSELVFTFRRIVAMSQAEGLRYVVAAAAMFSLLLIWRLRNRQHYKIRKTYPAPKQIAREAFNSALTIPLFQLTYLAVTAAAYAIHLEVVGPSESTLLYALSFPAILLAHDCWFYWTHRAMHSKALYRWVHHEHHKSFNPSPLTAYSFAIPEAVIEGAFLPLYVLLVPVWPETVLFFVVVQVAYNVAIHSGVEWFPRLVVTHPVFGWIAGVTHHDLHHSGVQANYGLYFRIWDRLMGTEHPDFVRIYEHVRSREAEGDAYSVIRGRSRPATAAVAETRS